MNSRVKSTEYALEYLRDTQISLYFKDKVDIPFFMAIPRLCETKRVRNSIGSSPLAQRWRLFDNETYRFTR